MDSTTWNAVLASGVTRVPAPLPLPVWRDLYARFAAFAEIVSSNPEYGDVFDRRAKAWQSESGLRLHFSGYFSPYYRDRMGQEGRDNKRVIQFCEPYYRYLWEKHSRLLGIPEFRELADGMLAALYSSLGFYTPLVQSLTHLDGALAEALLPRNMMPPVAIRLIHYQGDARYFTNPHVDKSAITIILDTDEPQESSCLVFAPHPAKSTPRLSEFAPALAGEGEAVIFFGAAPREANYSSFVPAGHAVRPLRVPSVRNVAIFFWLLPGVDLAKFDTSIPFIDDLGLSRSIAAKYL